MKKKGCEQRECFACAIKFECRFYVVLISCSQGTSLCHNIASSLPTKSIINFNKANFRLLSDNKLSTRAESGNDGNGSKGNYLFPSFGFTMAFRFSQRGSAHSEVINMLFSDAETAVIKDFFASTNNTRARSINFHAQVPHKKFDEDKP